MSAPFNNLPFQLSSFIGRERELTEVKALLASARLVTLTGAAGCGKTRLALHTANTLSHTFADGVWLVELAPLADARLVPQAVAKAVNVVEQPGRALSDALLDYLHAKHLLLVLDNCEHLSSACAQLAETVLLNAAAVRVLVTSRRRLAIAGETIYSVPGLTLPPHSSEVLQAAEDLQRYDAIQLFVERARAVVPNLALTRDNAHSVVEICRRLDGIPLALELASARVNVLTVEQIAARLDHRFAMLTSSPATLSQHHTLRAALDWSYDLLSAAEQTLLRRLSVFAAGCTLDVAEAVCADDELATAQILDLLSSLVNQSLVVAETLKRGTARYHLLETIREYAQEELIASGEGTRVRNRYLNRFLELGEETAPKLRGQYQPLWLNWLEGEHDNFRAVLDWSLSSHQIEAGLRVANALYTFWMTRGYLNEGRAWFERLLAQADNNIPPVVRAKAATYTALLAGLLGDAANSRARGREARELCEEAGDAGKPVLAFALMGMGSGARASGDYASAFKFLEQSIQIYRELGDRLNLAFALQLQALNAIYPGNFVAARAALEESVSLARGLGDAYRVATTIIMLGDVARCEQDYARAQTAYAEGLSLLRELGATRDVGGVLHNLAHSYLHQGDVPRAHALFSESMATQRAQANAQGVAECLTGFAAVACVRGLPIPAARLLSAAVSLGGTNAAAMWPAERFEYEHYLTTARAQLTDEEFEAAQHEGRALTMERAIDYALRLPLAAATAQETKPQFGGLTAREREVAALIARGKSNGEIADGLVVGKRTVEKHIANIMSKLTLTNRAQIVRWAIENNLSMPK